MVTIQTPILRLMPRLPRLRRLWRCTAAAFVCAVCLALVTTPARAQSTEELKREIEQLKGDYETRIKATMTGAHVTQMVSALLQHGPRHLRVVRSELETWMEENEWDSLDQMRGNMSFDRVPDPAAYERANFRMMLR